MSKKCKGLNEKQWGKERKLEMAASAKRNFVNKSLKQNSREREEGERIGLER